MIDSVSGNIDNLVINKGGGTPPPPPSSPEINSTESGQAAAEVQISSRAAQENNKSERVEQSQSKREQSLEDELRESIKKINDTLGSMDREILFKMDKKIDKHYISVIDKTSKEVIREFPPEEIRTFIARFDEFNERLHTSTSDAELKSLIVNLEV